MEIVFCFEILVYAILLSGICGISNMRNVPQIVFALKFWSMQHFFFGSSMRNKRVVNVKVT